MSRLVSGILAALITSAAVAGGAPARFFGAQLAGPVQNTWGGATLPTAPTTFSTSMPASLSCANTNHRSCFTPTTGAELQTDLNTAAADTGANGDIIECTAGTTYTTTGTFMLPARASGSTGTIYIISSDAPEAGGSGLPAAGTRASPSNVVDMCSLRTSTTSNGGYLLERATGAGVSDYRLVGIDLELVNANGSAPSYVVSLNNGDTSASTLAQHIVFDRDFIDGSPAYGVNHAIEIDGEYNAVIESYFGTHVYSIGNADTQDILGYNGLGPYIIDDNYLQAGGETTLFGGADTSLPSPSESSDITEDNNHFYKNNFTAQGYVTNGSTSIVFTSAPTSGYIMLTMGVSDPGGCLPSAANGEYLIAQTAGPDQGAGTYTLNQAATCTDGSSSAPITITGYPTGKNMVEFKTGQRVQFKDNYLENAGAEGQARSAFTMTSRNQDGPNPWYQLTDFDIEDNVFTNAQYGGMDILCQDNVAGGGFDTAYCKRILIRGNLFILSANDGTLGTSAMLFASDSPANDIILHFTSDVAGLSAGTLTAAEPEGVYSGQMGYSGSGSYSPYNYYSAVTITIGNGTGPGTSTAATWTGTFNSPNTPTPITTADVASTTAGIGGSGSDFIVDHNTFVGTATNGIQNAIVFGAGSIPMAMDRFVWSNNLYSSIEYAFADGTTGITNFAAAITPQCTDCAFVANVLTGVSDGTVPAGNYSPAANASVGFTSFGSNTSAAGYALTTSSPYHGSGVSLAGLPYNSSGKPDGTDIGANISLLPTN